MLQSLALLIGHLWFSHKTTPPIDSFPILLTIALPIALSLSTILAIGIIIIFRGTVRSRYIIATAFAIQPAIMTGSNLAFVQPLIYSVIALSLLTTYGEWKLLAFASLALLVSHLGYRPLTHDHPAAPSDIFSQTSVQSITAIVLAGAILSYSLMVSERVLDRTESQRQSLERERADTKSAVSSLQAELDSTIAGLHKENATNADLKSQLAKAQKLQSIGQLAAGVAHEINTPAQYVGDNIRFVKDHFHNIIRILQAYDELLDNKRESKRWAERAQSIKALLDELDCDFLISEIPLAIDQTLEGVERISHIVKAMKDYSHPGVETRDYADLNQAICSTLAVCENRWKRVADVKLDLDHSLPQVPCFIAEINQVVLNLIINASDAIEDWQSPTVPRGEISIRTKCNGDHAEIYVSDNGPGIPPDVKEKIFDPFFTTKEVGKGSGQGLCISHDVIVVRHGGELRCNSSSGQGTTFVIRLPLAPNAERMEAA